MNLAHTPEANGMLSPASPPIGRFAPSPTGPLHFGTLLAALGSYLAVKKDQGRWLLRIEDLDQPRVVAGAEDDLLFQLERFGFEWDGPIVRQSQRSDRYHEVLAQLQQQQRTFACNCSRREILASAPHQGEEGPVYPGLCRAGMRGQRQQYAIRLRVNAKPIVFHDAVFGDQCQNLEQDVGDFVLYRADGVFAYQLAVVVDDIDSGVTQVVRGADLLFSSARQIYLYHCLGQPQPDYLHLPLALADNGEKLSKRHLQKPSTFLQQPAFSLWQALSFLGQDPPDDLLTALPEEILTWGCQHFQTDRIPSGNRVLPGH